MKNANVNIDDLLARGLITQEEYDNINNNLKPKKKAEGDSKNKTTLLLNILAGVLLAIGIIWIVAANWNDITSTVKITTGIILLLASCGWVIYSKLKEKNLELQSIVFLGVAIANIALISQTYHIMGDIRGFGLLIIIMLAAIPFYTKSKVLTFLSFILNTLYVLTFSNFFIEADYHKMKNVLFILLFLISVVIVYAINILHMSFNEDKIFDIKLPFEIKNRGMLNLELLSLMLFMTYYSQFDTSLNFTGLIIITLGYFLAKMADLKFQRKLYLLSFMITAFALTFEIVMYVGIADRFGTIGTILFFALAILMCVYYFAKRFKDDKDKCELFIISGLIMFLIQYTFGIQLTFIWAFYILAFAIQQMYYGVVNNTMKNFNFGEAIFVILILRYLFEEEMSILARGIICIVIAVIILISNNYLAKKIKNKNNDDKKDNNNNDNNTTNIEE